MRDVKEIIELTKAMRDLGVISFQAGDVGVTFGSQAMPLDLSTEETEDPDELLFASGIKLTPKKA